MGFEADLHAHLAGDAGISSLVADRVQPVVRKQGSSLPALTYQVISDLPQNCLDGYTAGLRQFRVQVDCWASSYGTAKALAAAVGSRMNTAAANFAATLNFAQDLYEDQPRIFRVLMEFSCWFRE